ncbi:beta-galactosidase [Humibacter sp.]|uniref:beta-galactosidase n=1 Tax=Humibacter sp. TaxID=1940291 RepID=UPI003F821DAA
MGGRTLRLKGLAYGGDYNPDQWPEEVWSEDIRLMSAAGVNFVTLPVFSWPRLEPRPGQYDFDWLDRIIDMLWEAGIAVDLATATATPPAWLVREHPEMLPWNADGVRLEFGSRQAYCPSSPVFREHVAGLARVMAERYGTHPAVRLWHVSNEYGDHVARCWCPVSAAHFRRWLQDRYGSIDVLNDAWGTSCWGQNYIDWGHIEPPRTSMGPINPAQQLDFERFSSDALLELFKVEVDVLHEVTPDLPVTTNFMSMFRELDYWDFAAAEDLVTDDAYPDPADRRSHIGAALNYGLMRSLKGGAPWLLLEQAPSAVSWRDVNLPKAPGQMRLGSLQAIAHGSDGAMVFQWRQARFGPEKFHSAMVGHRGERSRTFQEASSLGAELQRLAPVKGSRVRAEVALVVDWDSWWGLSAPDSLPSLRLDWARQARTWHAALYELGHTVDVVQASGPFDGYRMIVVPNLYLTTPEQAEALAAFASSGGVVVVGPFSGVVDATEKVHDGGAPGLLRELLGVEVDEWWPISDDDRIALAVEGGPASATVWSEWLEVADDVEPVAEYLDGVLEGRAAVTRRRHGEGRAWYISACIDPVALKSVLGTAADEAGLKNRRELPESVEVVTRSDGDADFVFVLNHGSSPTTLAAQVDAVDLLTGTSIRDGVLDLPGFGAAVLTAPVDVALARGIRTPLSTSSAHTEPDQEARR